MSDYETFIRTLESEGEDNVRKNIRMNAYPPQQRATAENWLADRDRRKQEKERADTLKIALSAKRASWAAVFVSLISVLVATVALVR